MKRKLMLLLACLFVGINITAKHCMFIYRFLKKIRQLLGAFCIIKVTQIAKH